jgi:predicted transcriptional regulator
MDAMEKDECIAHVVAACIASGGELTDLQQVYDTIITVRKAFNASLADPVVEAVAPEPKSAKEVKASFVTKGLVSFEDGKVYKSLKRHLSVKGLTPEDYRAKHGLPADYPMTSPEYSRLRSALAKKMNLGKSKPNQL